MQQQMREPDINACPHTKASCSALAVCLRVFQQDFLTAEHHAPPHPANFRVQTPKLSVWEEADPSTQQ